MPTKPFDSHLVPSYRWLLVANIGPPQCFRSILRTRSKVFGAPAIINYTPHDGLSHLRWQTSNRVIILGKMHEGNHSQTLNLYTEASIPSLSEVGVFRIVFLRERPPFLGAWYHMAARCDGDNPAGTART